MPSQMIIISIENCAFRYNSEYEAFEIISLNPIAPCCPCCGFPMHKHGKRKRHQKSWFPEEIFDHIWIIQRWRCTNEKCRRVHHALPAFLIPYKMHDAFTIESALTQSDTFPLETQSMKQCQKRWTVWFNEIQDHFQSTLKNLEFFGISIEFIRLPLRPLSRQIIGWLPHSTQIITNCLGYFFNPV